MPVALFSMGCLSTPITRFSVKAIALTTNGTFPFYQAVSIIHTVENNFDK